MAGKRNAISDLNHDNWDDEYEHEEAGTFKRAPEEVISKRVIKTARRRNPIGGDGGRSPANAFSSFGGFSKPVTTAPVSSASPFAFLSTLTPAQSSTNGLSPNTSTSKANTSTSNPLFNIPNSKESSEKSTAYLNKLQNLNESVAEWIKTHVDKNPYCILTPIFKDYEKHLTEIESFKKLSDKPDETKSDFPFATDDNKISQATTHSATIFGKSDNKKEENPFLSKKIEEKPKETTASTTGFSFGNAKLPTAPPTSGFTFGAGTPFQFSNVVKPADDNKKEEIKDDEEEEPPTNDFTPVVEDDNIFTKRCKVFIKKDDAFADRGVGQLFLKPVENSEKIQLIVRQDTSLGNLILNLILSKSIPTQRMGKNNVMLVCIPDEKSKPPPVPVLLRVKTAEEADELLKILDKNKK